MVHWFDQHRGCWPTAACGHPITDEYTLWMSRVTCLACRAAVQDYLEALAAPAMATEVAAALAALEPFAGERVVSGVC